jgi:hypothetical protein
MKNVLITSMLALGVGCGASMAQTRQPAETPSGANANCASGTADCQTGSKMDKKAQGKAGTITDQQAQEKAKVRTGEQAQGKAGAATDQQAQGKAKVQTGEQAQGKATTDQQAQGKAKVQTGEQAQGKAGAATDQQAQGKAKVQTGEQAQGKAGAAADQQAQGKAKVQTGEQAQDKAGAATDQQAQGKAKVQTGEQAQDKATSDQQAEGKASKQDTTSTGSINNVTVEQKTQITQVFREVKVEPVARVDFDISVGVEVPRHKIRLHRLPERIVKIVPAYQSYEYFALGDGRIVIVEPDTLKIVAILT